MKYRPTRIRELTNESVEAHLYILFENSASFGDSYRYRCCVICGALAPTVRQGTLRFPYAGETGYPFSNPPPPNLYEIFAAVTVLLYFLQKARW